MKYCLSLITENINYACCLFPCAPLMSHEDIIKSYNKIRTNKYKYVFTASNFSHPVERSFKLKNGKIDKFLKNIIIQILRH